MPIEYLMEAIERMSKENKMIMHEILDKLDSAEKLDSKWDEVVALALLMLDELEEEE